VAAPDPELVASRAEFVLFVRALSEADDGAWENPQTARYLEALAAFVEDSPVAPEPTWGDFAKALLAATLYE
jgi:hypothetical protein